MKIIGKTANGYLVETTEAELAKACGFGWPSDKAWIAHTLPAREQYGTLKIGSVIDLIPSFDYLNQLRSKEITVRTGAKVMRELADMMEIGVPTAIVPPPEQGSSGGD